MARLKEQYTSAVAPALMKKFSYKSVMQIPKLDKVVINVSAGEAADLTKEQKAAWNNIIERLQRTNGTAADIIIVASMILNQAASHWNVKIPQ